MLWQLNVFFLLVDDINIDDNSVQGQLTTFVFHQRLFERLSLTYSQYRQTTTSTWNDGDYQVPILLQDLHYLCSASGISYLLFCICIKSVQFLVY